MKTLLGRELILMLTIVKGWQKNDSLGLCPIFIVFKDRKKTMNHILVSTMAENWRQFYKQVIFDILCENFHIFKTKLAIVVKLSGNVQNRLLVTSAKFAECSKNRKSYVKISILGLFFLAHPVCELFQKKIQCSKFFCLTEV